VDPSFVILGDGPAGVEFAGQELRG